jgi:drebrin-like protein
MQTGLVPSNYLEELHDDAPTSEAAPVPAPEPEPAQAAGKGASAVALYDYEAGEDNELSFPEDAVITNIVSLDTF